MIQAALRVSTCPSLQVGVFMSSSIHCDCFQEFVFTAGSERKEEIMVHISQPEFCQSVQWTGPVKMFFLSLSLYTDSTPLHSCTFDSLVFQTCQTHLTILPTHSRWLKVCHETQLHSTWLRSVGERRHEWKRSRTPRPSTAPRRYR